MFYYLVIFVALAGIVKTSVIINVFEDGEVKTSHSLRGCCNFRACDQLCRRVGFKGGACVGDRCKCDINTPLKEEYIDYSTHDSCNYQACDQLCRRLGFPGGACVGGRCKCDNFAPLSVKERPGVKTEATHLYDSCNSQACNQFCRNLGFPGGSCVGDTCECANFKEDKDQSEAATLNELCDVVRCNEMCHRLNFIGGMCIDGNCECY